MGRYGMYGWPWKCGNCGEFLRQKRDIETWTDSYWCNKCKYGFYVTYGVMTAEEFTRFEREYQEIQWEDENGTRP